MKKASWEVSLVAKKRIRQFIQEENREVERVIPIILQNTIEKTYETYYISLGNSEKKVFTNEKQGQQILTPKEIKLNIYKKMIFASFGCLI